MLKNLWRTRAWGASCCWLLLLACTDSETLHCVPGESVACLGAGDCAGTKTCDTNGVVYGSCQCPAEGYDKSPQNSNSPPPGCSQGTTRACLGADECAGVATCGNSGTFGACQCSPAASPVPALRPNVLGAACLGSGECGSSLICWAESGSGPGGTGGPAAGYCTVACRASADCGLFQQAGDCLIAAGAASGVCLAACSVPSASVDCGGRAEVACATYAALSLAAPAGTGSEQGLCVPQCHSDTECGARHCDTSGPVATCVGGPDAGVADAGP